MQNEGMAIVQIRDVPDDVQAELVRRAKASGQSLQQYMRALLIDQTRRADASLVWAQAAERARAAGASYPLEEAVSDVRGLREEDRVS